MNDLHDQIANMVYRRTCDDGSIEYLMGDGHIDKIINLISDDVRKQCIKILVQSMNHRPEYQNSGKVAISRAIIGSAIDDIKKSVFDTSREGRL